MAFIDWRGTDSSFAGFNWRCTLRDWSLFGSNSEKVRLEVDRVNDIRKKPFDVQVCHSNSCPVTFRHHHQRGVARAGDWCKRGHLLAI